MSAYADRRRDAVAYDEFQATRVFSGLDALRAFSVVAVIWQHTSGMPGPAFFSKGHFGVDFFFAISGFLITTLLLRERRRHGRISLRGFYIRRVFRIMPIYYVVLAVYVVLTLLTRRDAPEGRQFLEHLPAFLTYTSNWFVDLSAGPSVTFYFAWSLATEEQFYLFWPPLMVSLLAVTLLARHRTTVLVAALGVLIAISQTALLAGGDGLVATILSSLALPILLGAAGAVLLDDARAFRVLSPVMSARWFAPAVFTAMLASLVGETPAQLTQVLMVLAVMSVCISESTLLHPVLRWRPFAYVGTISYGIYLMHMLCANALRFVIPGRFSIALFAATTVLVIAVAAVSFRIFESPLQRLGRRLSDRATAARGPRPDPGPRREPDPRTGPRTDPPHPKG